MVLNVNVQMDGIPTHIPTQLQIVIKIARIVLPGNQIKNFITLESASLTEKELLFGLY